MRSDRARPNGGLPAERGPVLVGPEWQHSIASALLRGADHDTAHVLKGLLHGAAVGESGPGPAGADK